MTGDVLTHLSPDTLRDLAAAIEYRLPKARARRALTDEGLEKLADVLLSGSLPTVGLFTRYRSPS
jgi:hypothetical protein